MSPWQERLSPGGASMNRERPDASEEFDRHVVYRTTFGPTTLDDLENVWEIYAVEILEGSNWQNRLAPRRSLLPCMGIPRLEKAGRPSFAEALGCFSKGERMAVIKPGSYRWNQVRRAQDHEAATEILSPFLDDLYDEINTEYFDGELVDIATPWGPVDKFRVEAGTLLYRGLRGRAQEHGVIELDWSVLTPTQIRPILIHEMVHVLGFKRWSSSPDEPDEQIIENGVDFMTHGAKFIAELKRLCALGVGDWASKEVVMYEFRLANPDLIRRLEDKGPRRALSASRESLCPGSPSFAEALGCNFSDVGRDLPMSDRRTA